MADDSEHLEVVIDDLTTFSGDAIVNAANSSLMGGGGVDGAIHRAGGPSILDECEAIVARQGGCPPGEAVITGAGDLPCRWVIHTVGPIWSSDQAPTNDATLASAYRSSLRLAAENAVRTVAFPNISTGVYGFPKERAADVALAAVRSWLADHPHLIERVTFVCFDQENLDLYRDRLG